MARSSAGPPRGTQLVSSDFLSYLREKAEEIAPGDVRTLAAQAKTLRKRAKELASEHPRLERHTELGLEIIVEHHAGRCPQIPYSTIALLAVALLYFADPLDVIPDWIQGAGTADDALVLELAFAQARPGIERYCRWKDISTQGLWPEPVSRPRRRPARSRA